MNSSNYWNFEYNRKTYFTLHCMYVSAFNETIFILKYYCASILYAGKLRFYKNLFYLLKICILVQCTSLYVYIYVNICVGNGKTEFRRNGFWPHSTTTIWKPASTGVRIGTVCVWYSVSRILTRLLQKKNSEYSSFTFETTRTSFVAIS